MTQLTSEEFVRISKLSPEARCDYAIAELVDNQAIYGLYGKDGWVMLQAEGDDCFPVWPHPDFAKSWEKNDFPDCEPKAIALADLMEKWLPGMAQNGTLFLMFPLADDEEGIILEADELAEAIDDELAEQGE